MTVNLEQALISIVIPVLNEAGQIEQTLSQIVSDSKVEIIVVDGGSQDETLEIARQFGVMVISSLAGRARQMNAGAAIATGEILLFLHADTRLPPHFDRLVYRALAQCGRIAGAFTLAIDEKTPKLRWIEKAVNWRSRYLQLPYGDQAIFLPKAVFEQVGKFPEQPIMEDFELVCRLKRRGRIEIISQPVLTSGRRWQKLGIGKTTAINQMAIAAYLLRVPPARIARWYYRTR